MRLLALHFVAYNKNEKEGADVNAMAWTGVLSMALSLVGVLMAWVALQSIRWDLFVKDVKAPAFQWLLVLLSLVLGHGVARFVMDYIQWSSLLRLFF